MNHQHSIPATVLTALLMTGGVTSAAQATDGDVLQLAQAGADKLAEGSAQPDELKMAALEGLMSAPPERALPIIRKVLNGNHSDELKSRALFVLSQLGTPEADAIVRGIAGNPGHALRLEAIRMIGMAGTPESIATLADIYRIGDAEVRRGVLEAYLIANDAQSVYQIALDATSADEFDAAVSTLGAMGATDKLRLLVDKGDQSDGLVRAYAMTGDLDSLRSLVREATDTEQRSRAISAIGMVGGSQANAALVQIYGDADDDETREAALQGLLISGNDTGVLELFRASRDVSEKRNLLRTLVHMGSDEVLGIIDETLEGN